MAGARAAVWRKRWKCRRMDWRIKKQHISLAQSQSLIISETTNEACLIALLEAHDVYYLPRPGRKTSSLKFEPVLVKGRPWQNSCIFPLLRSSSFPNGLISSSSNQSSREMIAYPFHKSPIWQKDLVSISRSLKMNSRMFFRDFIHVSEIIL